ncbi:Uncharacterised protein [Mycobacterium tuberculosis]|uniref:Uncharacterized protein n=1 Tax=Mycobacterium tuberculosis TaxID=1773 RepID=A0A0U0R4T9_MYCTX|nr:Uncharacterised protein [Mycobacterium tuberculosis]
MNSVLWAAARAAPRATVTCAIVCAKTGTGRTLSSCHENSLTSLSEPTTTTPAGRQASRPNMPVSQEVSPDNPRHTCLTAICVFPSWVSTMTTVADSCSRTHTAICS